MDLVDKVAIVTGGAMGIGFATCEALAAQGAAIVIADLKGAAAAAEKLRARGYKAAHADIDVSVEDDSHRMAEATLKAFGRIDILVNNAAIYSALSLKPFEQLTVTDWRKMLDVNVIGQFLCCKAVLPTFKKQGSGRIINISSGVAFKGNPGMLHYVASKGAIVSMTRTLATELGEHGVLVNSVAPGFTLSDGVHQNPELAKTVSGFSVRNRALKRDMVPADVVGAVTFFAGPHAAFITGQTLVVDGGAYYH
ncbi:SDR family oxidoreductase [Bradyrhizobium sp. NP1]|uniref:SDR family NAD(P)-dependent oxidoreductase n=1 Tax=Bradyrhizobium sp. NP1 TaxID=3049772 RepID=UPI0025A63A6C|nr:SDR family oxidoreductase [Bradyrhizobium sp. NP1]WJR80379.1 SDR family oxidoreductase [Bradyrhizobium sp. NP1]